MPGITPTNAETYLVDLRVDAVALCAEGANTRAHIVLRKKAPQENRKEQTSMNFEELCKSLQPEALAVVTAHMETLETAKNTAIAALNQQIADLTASKEELAKSLTKSDDDIIKSLPEAAQKVFEDLRKKNLEYMAHHEELVVKERFEKVKAIPATEEELKAVLKAASPAMLAILEKASTAIENGLGKATGKETKDAGDQSSAELYKQLEAKATVIATAGGLTFEKAFVQACKENSDLYEKYLKGVK